MPSGVGRPRATSSAALNELRGYYSTSNSLDHSPDDSDGDEPGVFRTRRRPPQGEVELMSRQVSTQGTPGYIEDRLRRRRALDDDGDEASEPLFSSLFSNGGGASTGPSPLRMPLFRSSTERRERNTSLGSGLQDLKEWHRKSLQWKDMLVSKLKKAASQPALAAAGSSGIAQVAEAAIASARTAPDGASLGQQMQHTMYSASSQRLKDCAKAD